MKKRLSHAERHQSIVSAAAVVFADNGLDGTTTKQIAAAARVSPALLYEHFPSKTALYRAVLRDLIRRQDAMIAGVGARLDWTGEVADGASDGAAAILGMLQKYYGACVHAKEKQQDVTAHRLLLASLGSDGTFARLLYRRTLRQSLKALDHAMIEARRQGNMSGRPISAQTAFCFIEHVGSMLLSAHMGPSPIAPYGECGQDLVQQAVLFCGRGLGFTEDVLNRHLPEAQTGSSGP